MMTGLRKSAMIRCLSKLYEEKGTDFKPTELYELSTSQLKNKINQIRGYKRKGGGTL